MQVRTIISHKVLNDMCNRQTLGVNSLEAFNTAAELSVEYGIPLYSPVQALTALSDGVLTISQSAKLRGVVNPEETTIDVKAFGPDTALKESVISLSEEDYTIVIAATDEHKQFEGMKRVVIFCPISYKKTCDDVKNYINATDGLSMKQIPEILKAALFVAPKLKISECKPSDDKE